MLDSSSDDENARPARPPLRLVQGDCGRPVAAGPLGVEPGVDVAFTEPPLTSDSDGRNLAGLDQAIDGA